MGRFTISVLKTDGELRMTDAERAEARAIIMWRVLIAAYDAWPHRIAMTIERALGRPEVARPSDFSLRAFGILQDTEEAFADALLRRMLEEGIIAGEVKGEARFEIVVSPIARAAFRQPEPDEGTWLSEAVRTALNAIGTEHAGQDGRFLRWATMLGFEP